MGNNRRSSSTNDVPVWNTPEILSSDRKGAQASIISPNGDRCSSSHEISRRERCKFDGIRVSWLAIVEEHPRNERCFSMGRSMQLPFTRCSDPAFAMEQQSPGCIVCLCVSSSESDSASLSSSRSSPFPHLTSCMINETRLLKGVISAKSSSASWNRNPSRTSSSMDETYASKNGVISWCEPRKSIPCNSRWRRFLSFGQVRSEGNESVPEMWRPKTVLEPCGSCKSVSNHRVESWTDRRDICDRGTPTSLPRTAAMVCKVTWI